VSARIAVIAAGGTGGHMFPAEALARELGARGWRIVLATDTRGAAYAEDFPADERLALDAATFKMGDPIGMTRGGLRILNGVTRARAAFRRLKPSVVVGFGGYPSLPALLAAPSVKAPTVIHEQNAVLGRVNRYLAPRAAAVACAFPTLEKASPKVRAKVSVVGNPIRPDIKALADRPYPDPGAGNVRILVTGGSQGARLLSEATPAAIAMLPEDTRYRLHVTQQTRPEAMDDARRVYANALVDVELAPFFRNIGQRLATTHLVIGRAGASTVCELAVVGLPSVLVPLAIAMDDHQSFNARLLVDAGAAEAIPEKAFTPDRLAEVLGRLLSDPQELGRRAAAARAVAKPDAAERLADLVEQVAA